MADPKVVLFTRYVDTMNYLAEQIQGDKRYAHATVLTIHGGLNERQRVAVVLNKFEDMGYADIAEVMGLSQKAVKSLLSRAREAFRATFIALARNLHVELEIA